ncbi:MAG: toll/interleukin-1 receptor domain-containing protein [Bacteroidia bacterium]|nr:toll/interleukin-1 receptor domain-containing protein [Bacteroidia bacterium]
MSHIINWKVIADELKEGDIIPVVGPEVLKVEIDGVMQDYRQWLAAELAKELGLSPLGLESFLHPVEEVMLRFYHQGDLRSIRPYQAVKAIISEKQPTVPAALLKLAQISKFRFYLTTMFEPFLEMAIKQAWKLADSQIRILENNLTKLPDDLTIFTQRSSSQQFDPGYIDNLYNNTAPPSIYYLYGRPSRLKSFALSEDDVLEANQMLQSSIYKPDELIKYLSSKRLLILGCNFPNWLARFFISIASPDPRRPSIQPVFMISDSVCRSDQNLADYLKRRDAQVFQDSSVESCIDKLYDLWNEFEKPQARNLTGEATFQNHSIFISYASEDREAANRLFDEIRSIGIPVWLDKKLLVPGQQWEDTIETNIKNSSIFIPVISSISISSNQDRFYRKEWDFAITRSNQPDNPVRLLPVCISPISDNNPMIPDEFRKVHWLDAPGGIVTDSGLALINQLYQQSTEAKNHDIH